MNRTSRGLTVPRQVRRRSREELATQYRIFSCLKKKKEKKKRERSLLSSLLFSLSLSSPLSLREGHLISSSSSSSLSVEASTSARERERKREKREGGEKVERSRAQGGAKLGHDYYLASSKAIFKNSGEPHVRMDWVFFSFNF